MTLKEFEKKFEEELGKLGFGLGRDFTLALWAYNLALEEAVKLIGLNGYVADGIRSLKLKEE